MNQKHTNSRRDFLRNALALTVMSAAAPGVIFGRILPDIRKSASGQSVASYSINLDDYPELATIGGSIKLGGRADVNLLKLNPDQVQFGDAALAGKGPPYNQGWYPIAITRVAMAGADDFKAVSTYCTHGEKYQINYRPSLTPNTVGRFVCPHQNSTFAADGTHIIVKNTPDVGDLRTFPATFDGEHTVTLEMVVSGVDELDEIPTKVFLDQNYPNPFNPSTLIRYGLPSDMPVRLTVHTLLGNQLRVLFDERQEAGIHFFDFSAVDLPSGIYFYRLETASGTLTRRMTVSK